MSKPPAWYQCALYSAPARIPQMICSNSRRWSSVAWAISVTYHWGRDRKRPQWICSTMHCVRACGWCCRTDIYWLNLCVNWRSSWTKLRLHIPISDCGLQQIRRQHSPLAYCKSHWRVSEEEALAIFAYTFLIDFVSLLQLSLSHPTDSNWIFARHTLKYVRIVSRLARTRHIVPSSMCWPSSTPLCKWVPEFVATLDGRTQWPAVAPQCTSLFINLLYALVLKALAECTTAPKSSVVSWWSGTAQIVIDSTE